MAIIQHFDGQKKMFFVVWQGWVEADEWFQYAARLTAHPAWTTTARFLADLQFVQDASSIREEQITQAVQILSEDRKALAGKQVAIVARDQFGLARRFGELVSHLGVSLIVFNNLDTACLFLGLDAGYADKKLRELRKQLLEE